MKFWMKKLYDANGERVYDKKYINAIYRFCEMASKNSNCYGVSDYNGSYYTEILFRFETGEKVSFLYNDDEGVFYSVELL